MWRDVQFWLARELVGFGLAGLVYVGLFALVLVWVMIDELRAWWRRS